MAKATRIKTVTLDTKVWDRGGTSLLLHIQNGRRQQCCLGILCSKFGVPDSALCGEGLPYRLEHLPDELTWMKATDITEDFINTNDHHGIEDTERVKLLNKHLKLHAIPLRFRRLKSAEAV